MQIESFVLGDLQTNCYLLWNQDQQNQSQQAVIIDPADDGDFLNEELLRRGLQLESIVLTHGHFDHCLGLLSLASAWQVPIMMHFDDQFLLQEAGASALHWLGREVDPVPPATVDLAQLPEITLVGQTWEVIYTPGHTPGSICLLQKEDKVLISGDTIFAHGSVGRTDFSYSSSRKLHQSLEKLDTLAKQGAYGEVFPGHGESFFR